MNKLCMKDGRCYFVLSDANSILLVDDIISLPENTGNIYVTVSSEEKDLNNNKKSQNYIENFNINAINEMIKNIKKSGRNIKLVFKLNYELIDNDYLNQIEDLDLIEFTSEDYITKISANKVLKTNKLLKLMVNDIRESNLSNYEKFLAVYSIVKSFKKYNEFSKKSNSNGYDQSRSIYLLLENDYMVCVGFSNLLVSLLKLVGINALSYGILEESHQINYVNIKDDKYGINTIIKCDPTSDNGMDDILIKKFNYSYIEIEPSSKKYPKTIFDSYLLGEDINRAKSLYYQEIVSEYPEYDENEDKIYEYVIKLEPSLKNESKDKALDIFRKNFIRIPKKYMIDRQLDAIINVNDFVFENNMTEDEKLEQKMNMYLSDTSILFMYFNEYRKNHEIFKEKYKNKLSILTMKDFFKKSKFVKDCICSSIDELLISFNENNKHLKIYFDENGFYYRLFDVDNALVVEVNEYLKKIFSNLVLAINDDKCIFRINYEMSDISILEIIKNMELIGNNILDIINSTKKFNL